MRIAHTMVFTLMAVLTSIEFSSQFDSLSNSGPNPGVPRSRSSSSSRRFPDRSLPSGRRSPERSLASDIPHPASRSPPEEPPLRIRSRSPPARCMTTPTMIASCNEIRYELNQLQYIRLTPNKNPHRIFELRRYTFPADKPIQLLAKVNRYVPMPTQEAIVLSTSDGDIFAILESSTDLAGLYAYNTRTHHKTRAKINMESGTITALTPAEIRETPVGRFRPIVLHFKIKRLSHNLPVQ